jgi:hypothetical protein
LSFDGKLVAKWQNRALRVRWSTERSNQAVANLFLLLGRLRSGRDQANGCAGEHDCVFTAADVDCFRFGFRRQGVVLRAPQARVGLNACKLTTLIPRSIRYVLGEIQLNCNKRKEKHRAGLIRVFRNIFLTIMWRNDVCRMVGAA